MTDFLLSVDPVEPLWKRLKQRHNIAAEALDEDKFKATYYPRNAGSVSRTGDTERAAVVAIIHELKLIGWDQVTADP